MQNAGLALDGGDPRMENSGGIGTVDIPSTHHQKLHDPNVTFEEYMHYAAITRADERNNEEPVPATSGLSFNMFKKKESSDNIELRRTPDEKHAGVSGVGVSGASSPVGPSAPAYTISDQDYVQASRAARTASWLAVFYLITTDILGPFSTPWAFAQMGYGMATGLYVIFGALAGYGGYLLWRLYLALDSDRYPLKTYGDIAFRTFGTTARHTVNILQSLQLLLNVGIIIVVNGQSLSQMSNGSVCFIILCFVWAIVGMFGGQIRTLARLGWLANAAIWMNVFVILVTMGITANSAPNFVAALASNGAAQGPVVKTAGPPAGVEFSGQVVGLMQAVFSYGGAMLFVEFMAEMKKPWDFWKGMLCAQVFIFVCYLTFGLVVYSYQGQFAINPAYQGISSYAWQTVGNAFGLVSGMIAAFLYGNIGVKVIYSNVLMDLFNFPALETKKGKIIWVVVVPIYWAIAFIVCCAIPQVSNLSGLVAAACILQFSYTFPPFLSLGYQIKKDAMQPGEGFDAATGQTIRHDGGMGRWMRGYKKHMLYNSWHVFFFLGSLTTAILGIYSAVTGMISAYGNNTSATFSCTSPVGA